MKGWTNPCLTRGKIMNKLIFIITVALLISGCAYNSITKEDNDFFEKQIEEFKNQNMFPQIPDMRPPKI